MEIKLFNRWNTKDIKVNDPGLIDYINLTPILVPKTGGRNAKIQFHKSKNHIVERLINKVMVPGHKGKKHFLTSAYVSGKSQNAYNIVVRAFEIIEKRLNKNPVEVFVAALENAAPREGITTIEYGGAKYPQAVDMSPQRRIDMALRHFIQGTYAKSFHGKKKAGEYLAEEIINAYNLDQKSLAIAKKLELERQADSSR